MFEVEVRDRVAIVLIKEDVFKLITTHHELLFDSLNSFESDNQIKAVLFLNTSECYGEKVYESFLKENMLPFNELEGFEMTDFCNKNVRFRELNILNRFIRYLVNYKKLCFTVLSGSVVTPFFGASLSTDIRYATPEMYYSLAHNKYGLHPSGALPYFLITQLGYNRAMEIMFSEKVSAQEALNLGLINKIVSGKKVLDLVLSDIKKITQNCSCTLRRTKQLSSFVYESLSGYFEYEASLFSSCAFFIESETARLRRLCAVLIFDNACFFDPLIAHLVQFVIAQY